VAATLGLKDGIYWSGSKLSFIISFHGFECMYNLQALLVVTSHSFVIVTFEAYNLCDFLLVNTIVPFHEP
jgi:hypothetical protein